MADTLKEYLEKCSEKCSDFCSKNLMKRFPEIQGYTTGFFTKAGVTKPLVTVEVFGPTFLTPVSLEGWTKSMLKVEECPFYFGMTIITPDDLPQEAIGKLGIPDAEYPVYDDRIER